MKTKTITLNTLALMMMFTSPSAFSNDSLYSRLGGYDAVAAVVDDLMNRLANDQQVGRVLKHIPESRFNHIRQMMVDFVCEATGGPCKYIGQTMEIAHRGMGLNESDWKLTVNHLQHTLSEFNVPTNEKNELINILATLKPAIVDS